jgi:hypothetical protein
MNSENLITVQLDLNKKTEAIENDELLLIIIIISIVDEEMPNNSEDQNYDK